MAKTKAAKTVDNSVTVTLQLGDKVFTGTGETMLDALASMQKPDKIMLKGILTVAQGTKRVQQLIMPLRAKRLFYNKTFLAIHAKQLAQVLK